MRRTHLLNVLSYIAVVACGLAIFLAWVFNAINFNNAQVIARALDLIAQCLAYIVVACYSFGFARVKGVWWLVTWVIAVVLIVVFKIIGLL